MGMQRRNRPDTPGIRAHDDIRVGRHTAGMSVLRPTRLRNGLGWDNLLDHIQTDERVHEWTRRAIHRTKGCEEREQIGG
jgi:hypothetical protein